MNWKKSPECNLSFEDIYKKLIAIEKRLESFEELKPITLNNENLCGKCENDQLSQTHQEIKSDQYLHTDNKRKAEDGKDQQQPEKLVNEQPETNVCPGTSQIVENEQINEEGGDHENIPSHDQDAEIVEQSIAKIVRKFAVYEKEKSSNTLLHLIHALNAKLYFEKMRDSRRNLTEHLPSFDQIRRANYLYEPNIEPSTSMLELCTNPGQSEPNTEEDFAVYSEFNDNGTGNLVGNTPMKKRVHFEEPEEDFYFNASVDDTVNTEDIDDHINDTVYFSEDEEENE